LKLGSTFGRSILFGTDVNYFRVDVDAKNNIPELFSKFVELNCQLVKQIDELFAKQLSPEQGVYIGALDKLLAEEPEYKTHPYTVLVLDKESSKEVSYHRFYSNAIEEIVSLLSQLEEEVQKLQSQRFTPSWWLNFYRTLKSSFQTDDWEAADHAFLTHPRDEAFLLSAGPIERYHDTIFGTKRYFSAVFMYRGEGTQREAAVWDACFDIYKGVSPLLPHHDTWAIPALFVGDMIAEGGEFAKLEGEAWSRPENPELAREVGSIKMLMTNTLDLKLVSLQESALFLLRQFEMPSVIVDELKTDFRSLCRLNLILHEMGHTFQKPRNATANLGKYYTLLEEPRAEINSLYLARELEKKGALKRGITLKLYLADLILFIYKWNRYRTTGLREEYLYSTTMWILKGLKYDLLRIEDNRWHLELSDVEEKLDKLILELFTFFNVIVRFGRDQNNELEGYRQMMEEETEKLVALLRATPT